MDVRGCVNSFSSGMSLVQSVQSSPVGVVHYAVTNTCFWSSAPKKMSSTPRKSHLCPKNVILAKFKFCKDDIFWANMTFSEQRWHFLGEDDQKQAFVRHNGLNCLKNDWTNKTKLVLELIELTVSCEATMPKDERSVICVLSVHRSKNNSKFNVLLRSCILVSE